MKISERYATARNTSNLAMDVQTNMAPFDVLTAAGMAAHASREAIMLWEVTFNGKTSAKLACIEMLEKKLVGQMLRNRWKGDARRITQEVFAWHMHGTCQPCAGRGYEMVPGTPHLSDRLCKSCNGTRKVKLPRSDSHEWLNRYIEYLIASAGGKVMQKLASDMDLR